jgi:hypothetical protein
MSMLDLDARDAIERLRRRHGEDSDTAQDVRVIRRYLGHLEVRLYGSVDVGLRPGDPLDDAALGGERRGPS